MKRQFPCGHSGRGQYCHRCDQEQKLTAAAEREKQAQAEAAARERAARTAEKNAWRESLARDPIPMHDYPVPVVEKAREVLAAVAAGAPYMQFGGKRLNYDRTLVSVPVGRSYRLVFRDRGGQLAPKELLTHEAYNKAYAGG